MAQLQGCVQNGISHFVRRPRPVTPSMPSHVQPLPRRVHVDARHTLWLTVVFALFAGGLLAWLPPLYYLITEDHPSDLPIEAGSIMALLIVAASAALAYAIARQQALATTLEQAVDNLPVLIAYIDAEQRFRFNNRAYLDLYDSRPKDLYGKHVRELFGEAGYAEIRTNLEHALEGKRMDFELRLDTNLGPRDLEVSYVPDSLGKRRGVYALMTDVTPRKEAERSARQHQQELARVSRLASLGELTTEIAHQINQPLAAIAMLSNAAQRTLEQGGDHERLGDWMATINMQAKRAGDIVQRLRRFGQHGEIKSTVLDLNGSAREAIALVEDEARDKQVAVATELATPLPAVLAANLLMEQVIYNLLHNAVRAVAERAQAGTVTIRTRADASRVWLEIFDPQSDQMTLPADKRLLEHEPAYPHYGLGLSISRSILSSYQGDLYYQEHAPGSIRIAFYLPRVDT